MHVKHVHDDEHEEEDIIQSLKNYKGRSVLKKAAINILVKHL